MVRRVVLPPDEPASADGIKAGGWWHETDDGETLVCDVCPRNCTLSPGKRGFCFVRQNLGGRIVSTTYGRSTGFCIDPVEKKPLNQFYPGTPILSFGTAGCNLGCKFCQNWTDSKSREVDHYTDQARPEDIARAAAEYRCKSVAFTYNDPIVWAEYAIDTACACRDWGIKTVAVTSGYIAAPAREAFYRYMDAANVDLKGFSEDFYQRLAAGHLEPVLDTFRWLVHESDVWVEITNLVIPQANDSLDEIRRMCDWIAKELGPDVPLHFTAFHPDFQLTDRGPTPPATLNAAYQVARQAGLRYVYTGNVADRRHQSTYCPGCGKVLIERAGYNLGVYALIQDRCQYCGQAIAGRYDAGPGDWGAKRQPIRIAPGHGAASPRAVPPAASSTSLTPSKESATMSTAPTPAVPLRVARPQLSQEQEDRVFQATAARVVAAVCSQPAERLTEALADIAQTPVFGVFVSLKRSGQLRSCCGFLGQTVPLCEAVEHAAYRSAREDFRFPPISPAELEYLDMEVWLLWGLQPIEAKGQDRARAITIGRHGLQIARGNQRGLLLPGVAVEHGLDEVGFLRQVCLKAGLPTSAWLEDDTLLMSFEGYAIHGKLNVPAAVSADWTPGGPGPEELRRLANFCRDNLTAMACGATPSYYLPGGFDGGVCGAALSVRVPGLAEAVECSKLALRPDLPLQATLYELAQAAAQALTSARLPANALDQVACGLSVLWDPAMHGTQEKPDLQGINPRRRAVLLVDRGRWAMAYDPTRSATELLAEAAARGRLANSPHAGVCSLAIACTEPRLTATNVAAPQPGPAARPPAVAGRFYPGSRDEIERALDQIVPPERKAEPWAAAMVPHAGWVYSGKLAAATLARTCIPSQVIILSPKHHPHGADWAVAPNKLWTLPSRNLDGDPELASKLANAITDLVPDAEAHRSEHAIEVQLPILARLAPQARVVGIALSGGELGRLQQFARQLAAVLRDLPERPLLVISTDMNHYADDQFTRRVDRLALDAIHALDPEALFKTVTDQQISMCGVLPAVVVMETLRHLGCLNRCEEVGYATSAEASGDRRRVVGYAGLLFA